MHICTATSIENVHSTPETRQTDTTSSHTSTNQETQHGLLLAVEAGEKHAIKAIIATNGVEKESTTGDGGDDTQLDTASLPESVSMLHKKYDDPTPLIIPDTGETMIIRRRWCHSVRLQWRILCYLIIGLAVLLVLYAATNRDSSTRLDDLREGGFRISATIEEEKGIVSKPKIRIKVDIYMESQCPDTADFLETQLSPTWTQLKEYMDLKIVPFGKARWTNKGDDDYSFQCQHGQNECLVNQLMCCGIERLRTPELYVPYILCLQGTSFGDEDEKKCAQQARLTPQEMQTCANSKHGRQLLQRMGNQTKSLKPPLYFVPWVLIEGKRESAAVGDLKMVICRKLYLHGEKPQICEVIPTTNPSRT